MSFNNGLTWPELGEDVGFRKFRARVLTVDRSPLGLKLLGFIRGELSPELVPPVAGQLLSEGEFNPKLEPVLVLVLLGKRFGLVLENGETVVGGTDKSTLFGVIVGDAFGDQSVVLASEAGLPVSSVKRLCASAKLVCASAR